MKRTIRKELIDTFDKRFRAELSSFTTVTGEDKPQVGLLYIHRDERMSTFVFMHPHTGKEEFTLELAGSSKARFPWTMIGDEFPWDETDPPNAVVDAAPRAAFRVRLSLLWPPYDDFWWRVSSFRMPEPGDFDALHAYMFGNSTDSIQPDLLGKSVDDSLQKLTECGLPYLEAVQRAAGKHGTRHLT